MQDVESIMSSVRETVDAVLAEHAGFFGPAPF